MTEHFTFAELTHTNHVKLLSQNIQYAAAYRDNLYRLANSLEHIRSLLGSPIYVNSAIRCPALNRAVGGVERSRHLYGLAADIRSHSLGDLLQAVNAAKRLGYIEKYIIYKTFIHIQLPIYETTI